MPAKRKCYTDRSTSVERKCTSGRSVMHHEERVGKGIFVSREWSIFVRVKCEVLDFSVVKCDLFYNREA
jgi:hypothetical protein